MIYDPATREYFYRGQWIDEDDIDEVVRETEENDVELRAIYEEVMNGNII